VSIRELSEFIGIDKNSAYRECKKTTENLLKRVLKIEEPGRLLQTHWVSSAEGAFQKYDKCSEEAEKPARASYHFHLLAKTGISPKERIRCWIQSYKILPSR
jgi:hypothetical protein